MDIQTALIIAVKSLTSVFFFIQTGLDQKFGQVYQIRIAPDCSMKILDWIRISKIPNLFNTNAHVGVMSKCALCKAAKRK